MAIVSSPAALPQFISQLLSSRQKLVAEIAVIDSTLARVTAALGSTPPAKAPAAKPAPTRSVANKAPVAKKAAVTPKPPAKAPAKKTEKAGMTAHEFVMAFVKGNKNPTTQDVNKHWKASGRLGNADNTMSQLTKLKKLKRTPLAGGQRGSTYGAL